MVKLRWIKEWKERKIGDISNVANKSAENFVSQGYAEYVKEEPKIKNRGRELVAETYYDTEKREAVLKPIKPEDMEMIEIPEQINGFNFVLVGKDKKPFQMGWQKKIMKIDNPELIKHIKSGGNYGVICGDASPIIIDERGYFLIVVDFDKKEFQDKVINQFPETFTTTSGSKKNCVHLWFASDNDKSFKIHDKNLDTLSDIQGTGKQIIAPGSIHSEGSKYRVVKDLDFAYIPYAQIEAILKPFDEKPIKAKKEKKVFKPKGLDNNSISKIYNSVSMDEVLSELNIDTSKNPTNCFLHSSNGGKCFSFNDETAHCFHCDGSWNKFSLIREGKNLTDKETFNWFAEKCGLTKELKESRKEYSKERNKTPFFIFEKEGQAKRFYEEQPFFFDRSRLWWFWDKKETKWKMTDKTDILNQIKNMGINTISSKDRTEIINALEGVGRENIPEELSRECIQFKNKIVNIKTGDVFQSVPKYFSTNPIPWEIGESEETPTMDKLFEEWVGKKYVQTLYEIIAYASCSDQFMQRLIALVGGGSNGKGTFIKLLKKYVGKENCVTSELRVLSDNNFETSALYKKLVCEMGEVSQDDLKNTNQVKKLSGEDDLRYCFKGKTPFTEESSTTCIVNTNSMPITHDRTIGFYRRWLIVDFPNQFPIKEGIISSIPNVEFENLVKKSLLILKNLYNVYSFTNEGDIKERTKRYEERSNPVMRFVEEYCKEDYEEYISLKVFTKSFNRYLQSKHLRIQNTKEVKKSLSDEGFEIARTMKNYIKDTYILNLKLDNIQNIQNIQEYESHSLRVKTNSKKVDKVDKVDNYKITEGIDKKEKLLSKFTPEQIKQAGYTPEEFEGVLEE